jgi:hypothetical protein
MLHPERDAKWRCLDCNKVWYEDEIFIFIQCENENCESTNIIKED